MSGKICKDAMGERAGETRGVAIGGVRRIAFQRRKSLAGNLIRLPDAWSHPLDADLGVP